MTRFLAAVFALFWAALLAGESAQAVPTCNMGGTKYIYYCQGPIPSSCQDATPYISLCMTCLPGCCIDAAVTCGYLVTLSSPITPTSCSSPTGAINSTRTTYQAATAPNCAAISGTCTCNSSGVWTGSCYPYSACTTTPPVTPTTYTYTLTQTLTTTQTTTVTNAATTNSATGTCSTAGQLKWNDADGKIELCNGSGWLDPSAGGTGQNCTGMKGKMQYAPVSGNDFMYCDGTDWKKMSGSNLGNCTGGETGKLTYDATVSSLKMCDGNNWRQIGGAVGGGSTVTTTSTSVSTSVSTVTSPVMCGGLPNCAAWCASVGSTVAQCPTAINPIICQCANSQYTACSPNCQ